MTNPVKTGGEFLVNTTTTNGQGAVSSAALADGGFIMTWESYGQDGDVEGIYAQRYHADGSPDGGEFQVNTTTAKGQKHPSIAVLTGGDFIITWQSDLQDGSGWGIYGQRYTSGGTASGAEFRINTTTANDQKDPSVAALANGGFVVSWDSNNQDGSGWGVFGQRYKADGSTDGSEFQVNTHTGSWQDSSQIAVLTDGTTVITWDSLGQDGFGEGIYAQRYAANGTALGGEFRVNTETSQSQNIPAITALTGGGFVITWQSYDQDGSGYGIYGQMYKSDGTTDGSEFHVSTATTDAQGWPSVAATDDGGFVVTWHSPWQDNPGFSDTGIYGQRFNADGTTNGDEFHINSHTAGDQSYSHVTALTNGRFVVGWQGAGASDSYGVYAQMFKTVPVPEVIRDEFQVNTTTASDQTAPRIATLDNGGFAVAWTSSGQDGSLTGVYGQLYDSDGIQLGPEFQINTHTSNDQKNPTLTALKGGGFVATWDSYTQDGSEFGIYGQRFDDSGMKTGNEFQINTYTAKTQGGNRVVALDDGGFLTVWHSYNQVSSSSSYDIYAQRYNADGTVHGSEFLVNSHTANGQALPAAAALTDGGFVVSWNSDQQDGSSFGIYGQRYNADGTPHGAEFRINSTTASYQMEPAVKGLGDGGFVVTWNSDGTDGDRNGIYGQIYNADGTTQGDEFRVNTYTTDDQYKSDITALDDGGFIVAWESNGQDDGSSMGVGSSLGVYGQRFAADGSYSGDEFLINTTTANHQSSVALAALDKDDFVAVWQSNLQDGDSYGIFGKLFALTNDPRFTQGNDTATLDNSGETVNALGGNDTVTGGSGNDIISGNAGNDILIDNAGNDGLYGGDGRDNLQGGAGNDILHGGAGEDWMFGGPGDDTYYVDETLDYIDEGIAFPSLPGGGTDTLISTAAWYYESNFTIENLIIDENAKTDGGITTLVGGAYSNVIHGNSGNNNIYANWGNDTVYAGAGVDHIDLANRDSGATGNNTVMFELGNGYDILWNFHVVMDRVNLVPFGLADYAELQTHGFDDGLGNCYFALGPTGTDYLYIIGHELSDLNDYDFIFS